MVNDPNEKEAEEVRVMDITETDEETDCVPSSFVDRPLNSAPWQEGERPETVDGEIVED